MATKKLQPHHVAWLSAHPDRTEEWLRQMFREGFDVHHVDGDHSNDTPLNLVLIEAVDHMRLHGFKLPNGLTGWRKRLRDKTSLTAKHGIEMPPKSERMPPPLRRSRKAPVLQEDPIENVTRTFLCRPIDSGLNELDVKAYLSRVA